MNTLPPAAAPDDATQHPFDALTPERVLDAVEDAGFACDGRLFALNSFENRVYQVGREDGDALIAKFYRPQRYSDTEILEEHAFLAELAEAELPLAAPISDPQGRTLIPVRWRTPAPGEDGAPFRMALFPRLRGRAPELEAAEHLEWLGRLIARLHQIGARSSFASRAPLSIERLGIGALAETLQGPLLPDGLQARYRHCGEQLIAAVRAAFARVGGYRSLRLHGDMHPGNLLWSDAGPLFVDFDDCCAGPAIQDLWMLLPGDADGQAQALAALLEGYSLFRNLDRSELQLIEPLRALRLLHYGGWLSARYQDPAFPLAFPFAAHARFWDEHLMTLERQVEVLTGGE